MASSLTPHTPDANGLLVRRLTAALTSSDPRKARPILHHLISTGTLSTTTATDATALLTALTTVLSTTPQKSKIALETAYHLATSLPPAHIAAHWSSLTRHLTTQLNTALQGDPTPTLAALSALLVVSPALSSLGTAQRAVVSTVTRAALAHAATTIRTHPRPACTLVVAALHAAPRELRNSRLGLDESLFHLATTHASREVRCLAARAYARLVLTVPLARRLLVLSERLDTVLAHLRALCAALQTFCTHRVAPSLATAQNEKRAALAGLSATEFASRAHGLCALISALVSLPMRIVVPLTRVLDVLCDGVRERVVDPYATNDFRIDAGNALALIPAVQDACADTLAFVLEACDKPSLQAFVHLVGPVFRNRLARLVLRCRPRDQLAVACAQEKICLYGVLARVVAAMGTSFLDFIIDHFQELFHIDVELHTQAGQKMTSEQQPLAAGAPAINGPETARSRKRRRHGAHRKDLVDGSRLLVKDAPQSLASMFPQDSQRALQETLRRGLDLVTEAFHCRGFLAKDLCKHLHKVEIAMFQMISGKILVESPAVFRAIMAAALSGGSNRMDGVASPLLSTCADVSTRAVLNGSLLLETRKMALIARTSCEALFHPRGPPFCIPSLIYPALEENKEMMEGANSVDPKLIQTLKQSQHRNEDDAERQLSTPPSEDDVEHPDKQSRIPLQDLKKSTSLHGSPAKDPMDVEGTPETLNKTYRVSAEEGIGIRGHQNDSIDGDGGEQGDCPEPVRQHDESDGDDRHEHGRVENPGEHVETTDQYELGASNRIDSTESISSPTANESAPDHVEIVRNTREQGSGTQGDETTLPADEASVDSEKEDQALIDSLVFE